MADAPKDLGPIPITTLAGSSYANFKAISKGKMTHPDFKRKFQLSKIVSWIMEVFRIWEHLRWSKRIEEYEMPEPPVFIIGHWRSGTTFLHNLLSKDEQFAYCTTFQGTFPNILLCHQWWFKPILKVMMPERRPSDGVLLGADFPQEEDFGLGNTIPNSVYNAFYFPAHIEEYVKQNITRETETPGESEAFKTGYRRFAAKAMLNPIFRGKNKRRLLSKNPPHTARIDQLLELYPDARFIHIERDPYDTIASFKKFSASIASGLQFEHYDANCQEDALISLYGAMADKYNSSKQLIPQGNLVEIQYDELIAQPYEVVSRIYADLDIENSTKAADRMREFISGQKSHSPAGYAHSEEFKKKVDRIVDNNNEGIGAHS